MGRPRLTNARSVPVSGRLSKDEAADYDVRRGPLTRSEFFRYLYLKAVKDDVSLEAAAASIKRDLL